MFACVGRSSLCSVCLCWAFVAMWCLLVLSVRRYVVFACVGRSSMHWAFVACVGRSSMHWAFVACVGRSSLVSGVRLCVGRSSLCWAFVAVLGVRRYVVFACVWSVRCMGLSLGLCVWAPTSDKTKTSTFVENETASECSCRYGTDTQ